MQQDFSTSGDPALNSADIKAVDRLWEILADLQIVEAAEVESLIKLEPVPEEIPVEVEAMPEPPAIEPVPPPSIAVAKPLEIEDPIAAAEAFERLQSLLVDSRLAMLTQPDDLIPLLLPCVTEMLTRKVAESQEEMAQAIAPTMGQAIKKQIEIEQDSIVDALYPIIGGTISKYLAETVRSINEQIENTLSFEGIKRKLTARIKGVSEAELILKEAMPLKILAVFLIQKSSGLIIAEIQGSGEQLDSDMMAGMLTAIRSFANDCMTQAGQSSELNEIDYGRSKIVLEVAGYCYLAIVVQGELNQPFRGHARTVLKDLVQQQGTAIAAFEGDYDQVPAAITTMLQSLLEHEQQQKSAKPPIAAILGIGLLMIIGVPVGLIWYHQQLEQRIQSAIEMTPELAIYHLEAEVDFNKLKLTGRLPNAPLRIRAEQVTQAAVPNWSIDNAIAVVDVPADPVLAAAEVKRVTTVLNQSGSVLSATYQANQVTVEGVVSQASEVKRIAQAYQQIPGVKSVLSAIRVQPLIQEVRFYFGANSDVLERSNDLEKLRSLLQQHRRFKIVGYSSDPKLALARAKSVQKMLIQQKIPLDRIQISSSDQLPPGVDSTQAEWLIRCAIVAAML